MVEMGTVRKEGFAGAWSTGDVGLAANLMFEIAIARRVTTHSPTPTIVGMLSRLGQLSTDAVQRNRGTTMAGATGRQSRARQSDCDPGLVLDRDKHDGVGAAGSAQHRLSKTASNRQVGRVGGDNQTKRNQRQPAWRRWSPEPSFTSSGS
jgi:hypothetical protein